MKIELRELSLCDGEEILEMLREIGPGENGFMNDGYDMDAAAFGDYLYRNMQMAKGLDLKPHWVPQTKYWLVVDGRPVGIGKLRHYLNENLRKEGGHIGYCIRPSARGKGYGNILLAEMLKKAAERHIPKALVTCNEGNRASRRVIEYNGGKLEWTRNGKCGYWIGLEKSSGIREMHMDDYPDMIVLWSRTPGIGLSDADSESEIRNFLLRNPGLSYCWKEEGSLIGTILCGHDGRRGYLYHTAVSEEHRGKGIGRALVEKSLQQLREQGVHKCHLFVFADNESGNAFWESAGWIKRKDILVYSLNI